MSNLQNKIFNYFEREPDLRVLFIFKDEFVALELEGLQWPEPYMYVEFKGDWFTTKYRLDNEWADKKIVIFFRQESPLTNKALQIDFPLMDVLAANAEYHSQDYAAFMQQYELPESMTLLVEKNVSLLQSDKMMRLLLQYYNDHSITKDIAVRGILSGYLNLNRVHDWDSLIIRLILMGREAESKKRLDFYTRVYKNLIVRAELDKKLESIFGVKVNYDSDSKIGNLVQVLKYNAITQKLVVADTDSYKELRITDAVALQQINRILEIALNTPRISNDFVMALDELGHGIREKDIIHWYGVEANYDFMPDSMAATIIDRIVTSSIDSVPGTVLERLEEISLRRGENDSLAPVIEYFTHVGRYYELVKNLGSFTLNAPDDYVASYKHSYYRLDQLYRQGLEKFFKINPESPLYDTAIAVKDRLNEQYHKLTNRINLEWTRCIVDGGGMSAVSGLRQQNFYDEVVRPATKKIVVLVCDALRYEVAQELLGKLNSRGYKASLDSMLAMLPTETKFCKPSLLPHSELRLYDVPEGGQDMGVDNKILNTIDKRSTHLADNKEGGKCLDFNDISDCNKNTNRKLFESTSVVYIFHDDIDLKSHTGTAEDIVESCRRSVERIDKVVSHIHETLQRSEVWITADHGFLFNDHEFEEKDKIKVSEPALEKKSRYYLTQSDATVTGVVKFPLSEVSGIDLEDVYVAVPEGTNRFAAPSGGYMFTHGGAALQEMIIPLLVSRAGSNKNNGKQSVGVDIFRERILSIQSSRLRFKLLQTEAVSDEYKERTISIGLYHNDNLVSTLKEMILGSAEEQLKDRKIQVDLTLSKPVDAKVLQLRVYDSEDMLNPLIKENVRNNTLISNDLDD